MFSRINRQAFQQPQNYWLACVSELLRPALGGLARQWSAGPPTSPAAWRRGLLVGANHIGDCLYLTPSLPALRSGLPDCEWFIAAPPPACEVRLWGNGLAKHAQAVVLRDRPTARDA